MRFDLFGKKGSRLLWALAALHLAFWGTLWLTVCSGPVYRLMAGAGFEVMLAIAITDIRTFRIPRMLPALLGVLAVFMTLSDTACSLQAHLGGGAFAFLSLLLMRLVGGKLAHREVLGMGDVYVGGALGLFLGLYRFLLCGMLAAASGLIIFGVLRRVRHIERGHAYPFSPFFAFGYALAVLFGDRVLDAVQTGVFSLVAAW